ncbi:MAG TPA: hypothetical protein VGR61_03080, partial [Candidatus Dormibacteraeota bacterium]|nr:hypothetical protein [Candidatus Dormibacteraeota bacterium]
MTPTTEILGRYGPATAVIERLVARVENLTHAEWRQIVAGQARHPPSTADQQRLAKAIATAQVSREAEYAVAMIREVVAAASAEVSMDPALDPMPVTQADMVMSNVVRALAAGSDLDSATLSAFYAPVHALVPLSLLSAAPGYGPAGEAAVPFIEDLA